MDSQRQQRYGKLLQKELAEIFRRDVPELVPTGSLLTVASVKVSPDLGVATVYLSLLGPGNAQRVIDDIVEVTPRIRGLLGRQIRTQARIIPELRFFLDDTAAEAERIDKLIASLDIPKEGKGEG